ncbi:hypothetical protein DFA_02999 [Cavenderia fasciculata]|uniref:Uncharacterized protein n=1 Tax=Cavenderia fasciculata TaxID=261658 RepID=F4PGC1_CACFS|nr:uncharacterized protein DFA_02999 [Cavenderia fasciculata]EGG24755.1 hypothetical protein DFA_02999 [Cavenderia fasciculata]|eukprot:XP_004362606.1 hypothetical protein DFA_02999 [Cavenderia fasciculata]
MDGVIKLHYYKCKEYKGSEWHRWGIGVHGPRRWQRLPSDRRGLAPSQIRSRSAKELVGVSDADRVQQV